MRKTFDFILGWTLVVAGLAMLVLPGPGLLGLLAGLLVLSNSYPAFHRFTHPVRVRAERAAAESVEKPWRVVITALGGAWLVACGVFWSVTDLSWVPFRGLGVGISLIVSGVAVWVLLGYSWRTYRTPREKVTTR